MVSRMVATGRAMKGAEIFTPGGPRSQRLGLRRVTAEGLLGDAIEGEVDDRRGEQGEHLAHQKTADDAHAQRMAQLGARTSAKHQRQRAEYGGHRRHENRPEAQQARLVDGLLGRQPLGPLGIDGEVDHQNRVFFTMPMSRMMPIRAMMVRCSPASIMANRAPIPADGRVERIVIG